ncbi:molybdopterin-dependent oxidoreductase [Gordonibacter sp.]|uniref:molybdopterin-dependent oxidoreductase n=1 Tax=Gordonibacter sp. TaxID=1968902 RepID=UPI002FCB0289
MKKTKKLYLWTASCALVLSGCLIASACTPQEAPDKLAQENTSIEDAIEAKKADSIMAAGDTVSERVQALVERSGGYAKNDEANEENAPKVTTLPDGRQIQKTPFDNKKYVAQTLTGLSPMYLNADKRGCTSCHALEDAFVEGQTYHFSMYLPGYGIEQTYEACVACHEPGRPMSLKDSIHSSHLPDVGFRAEGGNCESCHYIEDDGSYVLWDRVKYDVLSGITDVPSADATAGFEWNQTEITDRNDMWWKTTRADPGKWVYTDDAVSEDIVNQWTIKVTGDVGNPFEMTLADMIEKFGSISSVLTSACAETASGESLIYQAEAKGVPLAAIMEYAQVNDNADIFYPKGDDGYGFPMATDELAGDDTMLAYEMNGEALYPEQGYPVRLMGYDISAVVQTKRVVELNFVHDETKQPFKTARGNDGYNKPTVGVLSATGGQIFKAGDPVRLEGYADAFDEVVTKVEMSFDHGATWQAFDINNASSRQWVYWSMDLSDKFKEPGSYLIKLRASSVDDKGEEHLTHRDVDFLFNVQE